LASGLGVFNPQSHPATRNASDRLASESEADLFDRLRAAESIGRPLGGICGSVCSVVGQTMRPAPFSSVTAWMIRGRGRDRAENAELRREEAR
jgi:hypothetical protein